METKPLSKYFAELIGTFVLVFIGTGSAVLASGSNATHSGTAIGFTGIAFAFGIAVLVMVYTIGPISGCHINPAITIAMLAAGKISGKDSIGYIIAQIIGGILGSAVLLVIANGMPGYDIITNGLGQNGYGAHSPGGFSMISTLITELVMTFIVLFVIFGATAKNASPGFAGLAIGLSLTAVHLVGITVTGLSVNPARSLAPALFAGGDALSQLWLFIVGPIVGALLATVVWKIFKRD
jgi:aquaporin Z